jgi:hypothetical protein
VHVINCLELQPLLADGDMLNAQRGESLITIIQVFCAAGSRKVASRADFFQGTYSPHPWRLLYTLTCLGAWKGRDFVQ